MTPLRILPALLCVSCLASEYAINSSGSAVRVDYLIVAADDFADDCDALLAHRKAQGYEVGVVGFTGACREVSEGPPEAHALAEFLRRCAADWGTRYVLLVGDARGDPGRIVPMSIERARYYSPRFLSDKDLATDYLYSAPDEGGPRLHVGRFPVDTRAELSAMIEKTIAYESGSTPGPWQRRVSFVTGRPGLAPTVDRIVEAQFARVVTDEIPAAYDVEVAHADPSSPYCPFPPEFDANALRLLNEGALFYVYVGHGTRTGCDRVVWRGRRYPILDARHVGRVRIRNGLPVMVVIACDTGELDSAGGDCIGEMLVKAARGPVAFLGSSRICQPYGNALLGGRLVGAMLGDRRLTLGEAVDEAKRGVLGPEASVFRRQADALAAMVQGADSLPRMREDSVRHYNLLGDPALVLQRPEALEVEAEIADGKLVVMAGTATAGGRAIVSLEVARDRFARELPGLPPEDAPNLGAAMAERYREANDKAHARVEVAVIDGMIGAELALPDSLAAGDYTVRVFAWGETGSAAGARVVRLGE